MGKEAIKHTNEKLSRRRLSNCSHGVMAHRDDTDATEEIVAGNQDMRAANESYAGFLTIFKWGTIASALAALLVVLIIA
jgi:Bacterial aa3 type cytochrome c oxidase subunit IV